jgi:hypothetical protein
LRLPEPHRGCNRGYGSRCAFRSSTTTTVFGGHGKRNEFVLSAHLQLLNGGTEPIGSPGPIGVTAGGFLKQLVIEPIALVKTAERSEIYHSLNLGPATFFD